MKLRGTNGKVVKIRCLNDLFESIQAASYKKEHVGACRLTIVGVPKPEFLDANEVALVEIE